MWLCNFLINHNWIETINNSLEHLLYNPYLNSILVVSIAFYNKCSYIKSKAHVLTLPLQILIHYNYKHEGFLTAKFNHCLLNNNYLSFYFWCILLPDLQEWNQSHYFQWYKPLLLRLSHDTSNTLVPETTKFRKKIWIRTI